METSKTLQKLLFQAVDLAKKWKHEFVTPEHFLYILTEYPSFQEAFDESGGDIGILHRQLESYMMENYETFNGKEGTKMSHGFEAMVERGALQADSSGRSALEVIHVFYALIHLPESYAAYFLKMQGIDLNDCIFHMCTMEDMGGHNLEDDVDDKFRVVLEEEEEEEYEYPDEEEELGFGSSRWRQYVTCLNEQVSSMNPLIGREKEVERTIEILMRKDKNNPLHIGETGVGKTAITMGLVRQIEQGKVPDKLKNATVYGIDMGSMVAGTQYRGEFEKRLKKVMDGICEEDNPIVYLDEIHNLIGAGAVSGGSLDASNMLKPYLLDGHIRFIGATTFEEYKKYFEKSKSMVRRFENVIVREPSKEETIRILNGIKPEYETFHQVEYEAGTIDYMVELSGLYIKDRFFPDKAIDLLDEAGAYTSLHSKGKKKIVTKAILEEVMTNIWEIPKQAMKQDETKKLANMQQSLEKQVFGQTDAIEEIVRAVKIARAGLLEGQRPIANLLFVGPTGVGKTEIAKCLAKELDVELIRFDMSEYTEKHTVAKFIGAPAGYVGYEEGGLLTDAIRKQPHCVLLLDEIEKAHPDLFNILLQVMDYASLTDNQGRKADFRNVILIMTSNAGASNLEKTGIGFLDQEFSKNAIHDAVKKTFAPEFRNRLDQIVTFNSMNETMASLIVEKECSALKEMLKKKNVMVSFTKKAKNLLLKKGISKEFGARQMKRVINQEVKTKFVDELLFGQLKHGGKVTVDAVNGEIKIKYPKEKARNVDRTISL